MKFRTLAKKLDYGDCAYLYRNGALLVHYETYKGRSVELRYFYEKPIKFESDDLGRIVLHNFSLLQFGLPTRIKSYPDNDCKAFLEKDISCRTTVLVYGENGYQSPSIHFNEYRVNGFYHNSEICAQGNEAWQSYSSHYWGDEDKIYTPDSSTELVD